MRKQVSQLLKMQVRSQIIMLIHTWSTQTLLLHFHGKKEKGHSPVPVALLPQHTYPINNEAANEGTFPSCVPFTVKKPNLQRKPDPFNNLGKDKTCVVCRSVTTPGSRAVFEG